VSACLAVVFARCLHGAAWMRSGWSRPLLRKPTWRPRNGSAFCLTVLAMQTGPGRWLTESSSAGRERFCCVRMRMPKGGRAVVVGEFT